MTHALRVWGLVSRNHTVFIIQQVSVCLTNLNVSNNTHPISCYRLISLCIRSFDKKVFMIKININHKEDLTLIKKQEHEITISRPMCKIDVPLNHLAQAALPQRLEDPGGSVAVTAATWQPFCSLQRTCRCNGSSDWPTCQNSIYQGLICY